MPHEDGTAEEETKSIEGVQPQESVEDHKGANCWRETHLSEANERGTADITSPKAWAREDGMGRLVVAREEGGATPRQDQSSDILYVTCLPNSLAPLPTSCSFLIPLFFSSSFSNKALARQPIGNQIELLDTRQSTHQVTLSLCYSRACQHSTSPVFRLIQTSTIT